MSDGFHVAGQLDVPQGAPLGLVVDGSLTQGVEIRLDAATSVEDIKVGTFVIIQGGQAPLFRSGHRHHPGQCRPPG